jgi:hypothetical protein
VAASGRTLAMPPRVAWEAIQRLDGRELLLGGLPSAGYRLARFQGDVARRDAAFRSQAHEMLHRFRLRRAYGRSPRASAASSRTRAGPARVRDPWRQDGGAALRSPPTSRWFHSTLSERARPRALPLSAWRPGARGHRDGFDGSAWLVRTCCPNTIGRLAMLQVGLCDSECCDDGCDHAAARRPHVCPRSIRGQRRGVSAAVGRDCRTAKQNRKSAN